MVVVVVKDAVMTRRPSRWWKSKTSAVSQITEEEALARTASLAALFGKACSFADVAANVTVAKSCNMRIEWWRWLELIVASTLLQGDEEDDALAPVLSSPNARWILLTCFDPIIICTLIVKAVIFTTTSVVGHELRRPVGLVGGEQDNHLLSSPPPSLLRCCCLRGQVGVKAAVAADMATPHTKCHGVLHSTVAFWEKWEESSLMLRQFSDVMLYVPLFYE